MDLKEATNIFNLPKTATEDEFKSKYKELAKKYHPDIYKEDPHKFKQINEAYDLIKKYKNNPEAFEFSPFGGGFQRAEGFDGINFNISDIFNSFNKSIKNQHNKPTNVNITISFKDSVLGINKEISYDRFNKCNSCDGKGIERIKNDCKNCDGFGRVVLNSNGVIFNSSCNKCQGRDIKTKKCNICNSSGFKNENTTINVHIPPGIMDKNVLRLGGAGHFVGSNMFGDTYADVYVNVSVEKDPDLYIENSDVIYNLNISLLEALMGCEKEIRTIHDKRKINISPSSKNKEEIHIQGCGVNNSGKQRIILNVDYPKNTNELIEFLKEK